jgi:hypothetical protein
VSGRPVCFATTARFRWIAHHLMVEAARRGPQPVEVVVDREDGRSRLGRLVERRAISAVVLVTLHPVLAVGRAALDGLVERGVPVLVWNVDSPALTFDVLPVTNDRVGLVHVAASDATFWSTLVNPAQPSTWTEGIGPHPEALARSRTGRLSWDRTIDVLVPLNLRWCSRTLEEVEEEVTRLPRPARRVFEHASESIKRDLGGVPAAALSAALAAEGLHLPVGMVRQLARLVTYHVHLWRREFIVGALLEYPVVIDSNEIPARVVRGRRVRASLLTEALPSRTVARTERARAVVTTSFSHDLLHDRALNAALLGTATLAEGNTAFRRWFADGESMLLFDYGADALGARVELVLEHPERVEEIAAQAREIVAGDRIAYRWDAALDLLELAADAYLGGPRRPPPVGLRSARGRGASGAAAPSARARRWRVVCPPAPSG